MCFSDGPTIQIIYIFLRKMYMKLPIKCGGNDLAV
jgi:hypothetical protein